MENSIEDVISRPDTVLLSRPPITAVTLKAWNGSTIPAALHDYNVCPFPARISTPARLYPIL
jgi:hypothetical protein